MKATSKTCAITGANGYVGSHLAAAFQAAEWEVVGLVHNPTSSLPTMNRSLAFDLTQPLEPRSLAGIDTLIHCAYDFRPRTWTDIVRINVAGSQRLFAAAQQAGVRRIITISTISAFPNCVSLYGQAKLRIEDSAFEAGAAVVRPGLVFGKGHGGMIGRLNAIVQKTTIVPLIGRGDQLQYLAHIDDLSATIQALADQATLVPTVAVTAAHSASKSFRDILTILSSQYRASSPRYIPIPSKPLSWGLKVGEGLGLHLPFSSDNLLSLLNQNPQPDFEPLKNLNIPFREFTVDTLE